MKGMKLVSHPEASKPGVPRLHPEIANAIRRQRETVGVDYRKAGETGNMAVLNEGRKNSTNSLHNFHFQFSDMGYLPLTGHRLPKQNPARLKRKSSHVLGLRALSRSQSSIDLTVPTLAIKQEFRASDQYHGPNKVTVTDLTCLQFADTLFSNTGASTGMYGFSTGKLKSNEVLEETVIPIGKNVQSSNDGQNSLKDKDSNENVKALSTDPNQILPSITHITPSTKPVSPKIKVPTPPLKITPKETPISKEEDKIKVPSNIPSESKERKSILKLQGGNKEIREKEESKLSCDETMKKPVAKSTRYNRVIKNDLLSTPKRSSRLPIDPNVCLTIKTPEKTNNTGYIPYSLNSINENAMKRSVRFNRTDEIFEFSPFEPLLSS
jgi:hypothetical protein